MKTGYVSSLKIKCPPSYLSCPAFLQHFTHSLRTWLTMKTPGENFVTRLNVYTKSLQQQITSVQSLLFVLVSLLLIRWQGLQFLEGETWAPHCSSVSLHNNPFESTQHPAVFLSLTWSHTHGVYAETIDISVLVS